MVDPDLRQQIEADILAKTGVTPRNMMGTTAYMVGGRMFAFWVADGLVVKLRDQERRELLDRKLGVLFQGPQGRGFGEWTTLHLERKDDLPGVLASAKSAYDYIKGGPAKTKARKKGRAK
jgi:hypothetical protein